MYTAVEKENVEIIKLLLTNEKLDINLPYIIPYLNISNYILKKQTFIILKFKYFNDIHNFYIFNCIQRSKFQ